jgi:hypothetical protein
MKSKKRLCILILCGSILLVSSGCSKPADKQETNNMGNMDHSKTPMNDTTKK